ncbi:BRCA1 [Acrasis kona]|uniref:BRCA1 n=1 Tax=Acrasis kona TaxID=1008807 RepID=A0AAW2YJG5_9EUKA
MEQKIGQPPTKKSKRREPEVVVLFSGFKKSSREYSPEVRDKLIEQVKKIGGTVYIDESEHDIHESVTHIVAPPGARTPKLIVGCLTHRWIIDIEWVHECMKKKAFVDPSPYGFKSSNEPFLNKNVFLTPEFKQSDEMFRVSKSAFCLAFVEQYGGGHIIDASEKADVIIIGNNESKTTYNDQLCLKWIELIHYIYPQDVTSKSSTPPQSVNETPREAAPQLSSPSKKKEHVGHEVIDPVTMTQEQLEKSRIEELLDYCRLHGLPTSKNSKKLIASRIMCHLQETKEDSEKKQPTTPKKSTPKKKGKTTPTKRKAREIDGDDGQSDASSDD